MPRCLLTHLPSASQRSSEKMLPPTAMLIQQDQAHQLVARELKLLAMLAHALLAPMPKSL